MITICMNDRQFIVRAVICMSGNQSMEATWIQSYFSLKNYSYSSAQINHLYDV